MNRRFYAVLILILITANIVSFYFYLSQNKAWQNERKEAEEKFIKLNGSYKNNVMQKERRSSVRGKIFQRKGNKHRALPGNSRGEKKSMK